MAGESSRYHLAQYNLARLLAPLDHPQVADFVANLHRINELGDRSPGFVWRLQTDDGTSTSVRVRGDELVIVNFTSGSRSRRFSSSRTAAGTRRCTAAAANGLRRPRRRTSSSGGSPPATSRRLRRRTRGWTTCGRTGPTPYAFTFKQRYPPPGE